MPDSSLITLTTDFGYKDPFVGVMKGVILSINPNVTVIDLTHGIPVHDIRNASFVVGMNYRYFPSGSIHVVVVDPGVGSGRRPILVSADGHYFIGPDNGLFSCIFNLFPSDIYHLTSKEYFLDYQSPTFQGRDVFAPVAAYISKGVSIREIGELITDPYTIDLPVAHVTNGAGVRGEIILLDGFGNAISNIRLSDIIKAGEKVVKSELRVFLRGRETRLLHHYGEAGEGELACLFNSSGLLEIFIPEDSAEAKYGLAAGEQVEVLF